MFWRRRKSEDDLERELRTHLESEAEEQQEHGFSEEDARYAARRVLGNVTRIREDVWQLHTWTWLAQLKHDTRFGLRMLRRSRTFTAVAILSLALGIGANTAMFSILYAWFIHPLPFPDPDRLALIVLGWQDKAKAPSVSPGIFPFYRDVQAWKAGSHSLESLGGAVWRNFIWTGRGDAQEIDGTLVTPGFFQALGIPPQLGRTFRPEDRAGGPVVVISDWLWRNRLGASGAVLGQYLTLDSVPYRIVGVMPPSFDFRLFEQGQGSRLWTLALLSDPGYGPNGAGNMAGIARLRPGVSAIAAQAELDAIQKRVDGQFPDNPKGFNVTLYPLNKNNALLIRTTLFTLSAAIFAVSLVACFNIAGLQAGRALERQSELALRLAIGSGRARIVKQLLTENALLSFFATSLGVALAYALIRLFIAWNPLETLPAVPIELNLPVLLITAALGTLATFTFGLAPSIRATRIDVVQGLRVGGANYSPDPKSGRLRDALVAIQLAATVVLLVGTALLVRTLIGLRVTPLGFDSRSVTIARLVPQWNGKTRTESIQAFLNELLNRTKAMPSVESAAISDLPPLGDGFLNGEFRLKDSSVSEIAQLKAECWAISQGYFQTLSIPLLQGRPFDSRDSANSEAVVIVNELFARRWLAGKQPLGESIFFQGKLRRIIGVAADTKNVLYNTIDWQVLPQIYVPQAQAVGFGSRPVVRSVQVSIRSLRPLARADFQRLLASIDPNAAVAEFQSLSSLVSDSTKQPNLRALLLIGFSSIALLLAAMGIFGTVSQSVKQRRREMGIRAALGATPEDLVRSVVLRGLLLAGAGVLSGALISLAGSRLVASLLYGIKPFDPVAFLAAVILLLLAAALASLIPARRAIRTDPMAALRDE